MKWFNNLKLGKKIMILSTSLIVSLIIIGISGLIMLHNSHETIKTLNNDRLIPIYDLEEARSQLKISDLLLDHI